LECHKCQHNGKFKGVPYEETPCATCQLVGRADVVGYEDNIASPCARAFGGEETYSETMPLRVLADFVKLLVKLTPLEYHILQARYKGDTLPEIAAQLGIGRYAAREHFRKLLRKAPVLKKLVPVVHARKGPKPKAKRGRS